MTPTEALTAALVAGAPRAGRVAGRPLALHSWGSGLEAVSLAYRPDSRRDVLRVLEQAAERDEAILPRGGGFSAGDCALSGRGSTLLTARLNRLLAFDGELGTVTAEPGVTLGELSRTVAAQGFALPVSGLPAQVTLGGAIAADLAGLNHESAGTLGANLTELTVMLADGSVESCSAERQPALFYATVGGFGLTGIVLAAQLRLAPQTGSFALEQQPVGDADEVLGLLQEAGLGGHSAVAWLDVSGRGSALRRALVVTAQSGAVAAPDAAPAETLSEAPRSRWKEALRTVSAAAVQHPPLAGGSGRLRLEALLPDSTARQMLVHIVEEAGNPRPLVSARLDRMGAHSASFLAFPAPGFRLVLELRDTEAGHELANRLTAVILEFGGRLALGSDSRMSPAGFRACHPQYRQFAYMRTHADPLGRFQSDLSHRLQLNDGS